ncbi:MAG: F-type H+-transporting ATPase subunit epsilon [Nitriliruptoraceae bacterium]|jgi:F-type H+-transporting ATPase subunit epsilon
MATFTVDVVSAERTLYSAEATGLFVTTTTGSLGILPGHQPILAGLDFAEMHLDLEDGTRQHIAVHRGYVYYSGGETAVILADTAELAHEIDVVHERKQLVQLEEMQTKGVETHLELPAMLRMTKARIQTAEKAAAHKG